MKKLTLGLMLSVGLFATYPTLVQAKSKEATCQIDEGGQTRYKGKCNFESQGGGSFYISHPSFVKKFRLKV
ncbi:hypothetical protein [Acinetobacter gerneri]|uniref:hypothetical protein n=1 Tax=Acinetobacter gerneri TaxID=202952 RepID=UPI0023F16E7A|nr:hypothetical protein [Acinetobacter gerneri]MCH4246093.1 hypothetical protein [Acinetobacter gerneri]